MVQAIAARMWGDDYQARWFWLQACRLFQPRTKVICVAFETNNVRSLDDVAVYYADGMGDVSGRPLGADYYQVKYHVTAAGAITWRGLMDPAFINASAVSLLQRLHNAQRQYAPTGYECRFNLYSPWIIHPDDPLAHCFSQHDGHLMWDRLVEGGPRSALGKMRGAWRNHLGVTDDEDIEIILRPLRMHPGQHLEELGRQLNIQLWAAGFEPVADGALIHPYDDLYRKLLQAGKTTFSSADIEQICRAEGLWRGQIVPEREIYRVGIRSFVRWAEQLEDETDNMIDLTECFDGRRIRPDVSWQETVFPRVEEFLSIALRGRQRALVTMHAHSTIAYMAGYCLPSRSGIDAAPVQSTSAGRVSWRPDSGVDRSGYPSWEYTEESLNADGVDVALAISARNDVRNDVRDYIAQSLPQVKRMLCCTLPPRPSDTSIIDGTHAKTLAQELDDYLKTARSGAERRQVLHIFAAAPNGLLFFLGQLIHGFGRCVVYEFDRDACVPNVYTPSLEFPP